MGIPKKHVTITIAIAIATLTVGLSMGVVRFQANQEGADRTQWVQERKRLIGQVEQTLDTMEKLIENVQATDIWPLLGAQMASDHVTFESCDSAVSFEVSSNPRQASIDLIATVQGSMETLVTGVSPYQVGEEANGVDDNGNGVIDERGLAFRFHHHSLLVDLTLETIVQERRLQVAAQRVIPLPADIPPSLTLPMQPEWLPESIK